VHKLRALKQGTGTFCARPPRVRDGKTFRSLFSENIKVLRQSLAHILALLGFAFVVTTACRAADYTVHLVESAVTDHLILRDGPLPEVCRAHSKIKLYGCRGQYEPAS